jgi:UDP-N-acetylglucosamine--N-acetylmuramyl-(pentapeptide) pyrophosphoryl-undecaprenol N-acetylglucosamine transferase
MQLHKLLITGGHPTPALAVIDEIQAHHPSIQVTFVGRRNVNSRERSNSFEYQEVTLRKISFIHTSTKRGNRGVLELPYRTLQCVEILQSVRPDAVLSFGGYIGVPVSIAASLLKIPLFLHEQTIHPGTANIRLARLATKVMVSFPGSEKYFEKSKVVLTGNPLRMQLFEKPPTSRFAHLPPPVIFVQGGNLGSHSVNAHIFALLPQLVEKYSIIHQVGNVKQYGDWEHAQEAHLSLPDTDRSRYLPFQHLSTEHMADAYAQATLVISRSGANTVTELIALRKPAVLIPLPWSAHGEQKEHAILLSKAQVAEVFDQDHSSKELLSCIQKTMNNVQSYEDHYDSLAQIYNTQASEKILRVIRQALSSRS